MHLKVKKKKKEEKPISYAEHDVIILTPVCLSVFLRIVQNTLKYTINNVYVLI